MTKPKFSIDRGILAARLDESDTAQAAARTALSRHRDRIETARGAQQDYDAVRAKMAARERYLNADHEATSRDKHEAAVAEAKARLEAAEAAAQQAGENHAARAATASAALSIANACREHAARAGIEL